MWPLFDIWLWNLVRFFTPPVVPIKSHKIRSWNAVLKMNFTLVILMQILVVKVLHKGFQSKWLQRGVCERHRFSVESYISLCFQRKPLAQAAAVLALGQICPAPGASAAGCTCLPFLCVTALGACSPVPGNSPDACQQPLLENNLSEGIPGLQNHRSTLWWPPNREIQLFPH